MSTAIDTRPGSSSGPATTAGVRRRERAPPPLPEAAFQRRGFGLLAVLMLAQFGLFLATDLIDRTLLAILHAVLIVAALGLLARLYRHLGERLILPLHEIRLWALRMRAGNLDARIADHADAYTSEMFHDLNCLADEFQRLARNLDREVTRHTERLAFKTRSIQMLYDVAASVNMARDIDELLTRFLHQLIALLDARAGVVRLLNEEGHLYLVASEGLDEKVLSQEQVVPVGDCLCGVAARAGAPRIECETRACNPHLGRPALASQISETTVIAVPLQYGGRTLGIYNLFLPGEASRAEELRELLISIGRHLGTAIEKARLDKNAQWLSIVQERTMLAHELHDSVAQTVASLRYRVRTLEEMLTDETATEGALDELNRIRNTLDEAHTELRELMVHYRAPMDERGLMPAIEELMERFRRETGIALFVQKDCGGSTLPALLEMQVLRIIQEALANVRKHSRAKAVRVLMRCKDGEYYRVLVEDDGVGFVGRSPTRHGEHVGLDIMRERAERLGGSLTVESEPGEGTRVELTFRYRHDPDRPETELMDEQDHACTHH